MRIDQLSFWIGVITGSLLWFAFTNLRSLWPRIKEEFLARSSQLKIQASFNFDEKIRKACLYRAQGIHIANSLFSLDEVLIEPRLMTPLPQVNPDTPPPAEDVIAQTIPYIPEWPELSAQFGASTLNIDLPLKLGANFAIAGQPGCGKTTALGYLASLVARQESEFEGVNKLLPIFIHVADLPDKLASQDDLLKPITGYVGQIIQEPNQNRLTDYLNAQINQGNLLLLLDGLDELSANPLRDVCLYLQKLQGKHPQIHIVTTANPDYWNGLTEANISIFSLAAWGQSQVSTFINKWASLWNQEVIPLLPQYDRNLPINPLVTQVWLSRIHHTLTPFEWTCLVWSYCAGDVNGPKVTEAISACTKRLSDQFNIENLETLALQMVLSGELSFQKSKVDPLIGRQNTPKNPPPMEQTDNPLVTLRESWNLVQDSGENVPSVMIDFKSGRKAFLHPIFACFLAAKTLAADGTTFNNILGQQSWIGRSLTIRYTSSLIDLSESLSPLISQSEEPLFRGLFQLARWLKDTPAQVPWRSTAIETLAGILQRENLPMPIRVRALAALVTSEDQSMPAFFQQLLRDPSPRTVQIAVLGCSATGDREVSKSIFNLLGSNAQNVRNAACLALVSLATQDGLEMVAKALLHADEPTRKAAAEALSTDPIRGYAVLKEGTSVGDLLVRRAVVYGLTRIPEAWAVESLDKLRVDDSQWVVRNAAEQAIEARRSSDPFVPRPLVQAAQAPWLISFASRLGRGIAADDYPLEMLVRALSEGNEEERMGALAYLRLTPEPESVQAILRAVYDGVGSVKEAAANILYEMVASGITMPSAQDLLV